MSDSKQSSYRSIFKATSLFGSASYFDMSKQVVGIIKVRIDIADNWVGNGYLMIERNIFPSPSLDQGYNTLLMRTGIFKFPFEIVKYF